MTISRSILLGMKNISDKSLIKNQNTHFKFSIFFLEGRALYEMMKKKSGRTRQATDDNKTHAHETLDTKGYRHTLSIRNTHYFSTARVVA